MVRYFAIISGLILCTVLPAHAETAAIRSFGVLNQRSVQLTAEYWNPILQYVSKKSGVTLNLKMGKTAPDTSAMTGRGGGAQGRGFLERIRRGAERVSRFLPHFFLAGFHTQRADAGGRAFSRAGGKRAAVQQ